MAAPSKTQLLNDVYTLLKKRYKLEPRAERLSVLESIIYGVCHEGTTREQAEQALSRFREQFFDWNEVRVSSIAEIQDVLAGQDDAEERANRLRRFLRQLFEKTYDFSLDAIAKKPLKDSIAILKEYDAMESDYVLATAIQQGLGGHALPVDAPIRRGLARLGVVGEADDPHEVRSHLERAVPKNRGHRVRRPHGRADPRHVRRRGARLPALRASARSARPARPGSSRTRQRPGQPPASSPRPRPRRRRPPRPRSPPPRAAGKQREGRVHRRPSKPTAKAQPAAPATKAGPAEGEARAARRCPTRRRRAGPQSRSNYRKT